MSVAKDSRARSTTDSFDADQTSRTLQVRSQPAADPQDVVSPGAVVAALYEVISGEAELSAPRDWDRFRSLCLPNARFLITRWGTAELEEDVLHEWNPEDFIEAARHFWADSGFWERETWSHTDRFGNMAHVLSTYESRVGSAHGEPVGRGINSIQLVRFEDRWWIASTVWDVERPGNPIPFEYLNHE